MHDAAGNGKHGDLSQSIVTLDGFAIGNAFPSCMYQPSFSVFPLHCRPSRMHRRKDQPSLLLQPPSEPTMTVSVPTASVLSAQLLLARGVITSQLLPTWMTSLCLRHSWKKVCNRKILSDAYELVRVIFAAAPCGIVSGQSIPSGYLGGCPLFRIGKVKIIILPEPNMCDRPAIQPCLQASQ